MKTLKEELIQIEKLMTLERFNKYSKMSICDKELMVKTINVIKRLHSQIEEIEEKVIEIMS